MYLIPNTTNTTTDTIEPTVATILMMFCPKLSILLVFTFAPVPSYFDGSPPTANTGVTTDTYINTINNVDTILDIIFMFFILHHLFLS